MLRRAASRIYVGESDTGKPLNSRNRHHALNRLLDARGERLYSLMARLTLRREVATELFQELFVRLGQSPAFAAADDPNAYAFRTAINLVMEWRRKQSRNVMTSMPTDSDVHAVSLEPSPLSRMVRAEQYEQLLNGLSDLTESAGEVFVLRFIEQQSYEEIAGRLGKTPHRVRGLCHTAIRQLRQKFRDATDESVRRHGANHDV